MSSAGIYKKKASLLSLEKYVGKGVVIHGVDGRVVHGILKGFDSNLNLVLANTMEVIRDLTGAEHPTAPQERRIGPVVIRGAAVSSVEARDSRVHLTSNPFSVSET